MNRSLGFSQLCQSSSNQIQDIKEELIKLRDSVNKTLRDLEQSERRIRRIFSSSAAANPHQSCAKQPHRKLRIRLSHGHKAAHAPVQDIVKIQPQRYLQNLDDNTVMNLCKLCSKKYAEEPRTHERYYCSEERVKCERCCAQIKRKHFQQHIDECLFKMCNKCNKSVHYRISKYHISLCTKNIRAAHPIPQNIKPRQIQNSRPENKDFGQINNRNIKAASMLQRSTGYRQAQFSNMFPYRISRR